MDLSEPFNTVLGFRQSNALSCDLFNLVMETSAKGERALQRHYSKSVLLLTYTDDIDIIGLTKRDVTAAFSTILLGSLLRWVLAVNEGKTKYMLSTSRDVRRIASRIMAHNYTSDIIKDFIYLDSSVTTKNDVSLEIKQPLAIE